MKGKTAFLFLLAVLMLVVSCPFKRLLQAENNFQAFAQQSIKWNDNASQGIASKNTFCCSQKQKIILVKPTISKQQLPGSDILANQNLHTGFAIHYFLNGTERLHKAFAIPPVSTLPLFLQHRRLLI
ncbi:MAG TPA: hypothetical protein VJ499_06180 [Flavisolibacter sp.]|nr:hypothetical protein [Flavisolibacter sp.]